MARPENVFADGADVLAGPHNENWTELWDACVADLATPDTIVLRDANGDVIVPTTPTDDDAAASKTYVNTQDLVHTGLIASDNLKASSDAEFSTTDNTNTLAKSAIYIYKGGTIRIKLDITATIANGSFAIYRNGVASGLSWSVTTSYVTNTGDLDVRAGDAISVMYIYGTSGTKKCKNFRIYFDTEVKTYTIA